MPSTEISHRTRPAGGRGLFRNAFDRIIEARMREARRYVGSQLAMHGYDAPFDSSATPFEATSRER